MKRKQYIWSVFVALVAWTLLVLTACQNNPQDTRLSEQPAGHLG